MSEVLLQKNLNFLLKGQGRSLSKVAELCQMNKSTLHGYLNGVVPKSLLTLIELSKTLGVRPEDLLFRDLSKLNARSEDKTFSGGRFEVILRPLFSPEDE